MSGTHHSYAVMSAWISGRGPTCTRKPEVMPWLFSLFSIGPLKSSLPKLIVELILPPRSIKMHIPLKTSVVNDLTHTGDESIKSACYDFWLAVLFRGRAGLVAAFGCRSGSSILKGDR